MRVEEGSEATVPPGTVPSAATRFHHHHRSKVLLATDSSAEAELAARAAVEQADRTGSELHMVRVGWLPTYSGRKIRPPARRPVEGKVVGLAATMTLCLPTIRYGPCGTSWPSSWRNPVTPRAST